VLDLDAYLAMTRLSAPMAGPGGRRVVTATTLAPDGKGFLAAVWELDAAGGPARRLTVPATGTSVAAYTPDGSLLLRLKRPDQEVKEDGDAEVPSLWLLPVGGGEPRRLLSAPAGIGTVAVGATSGTVAFLAEVFPTAPDLEADRAHAKAREQAGTSALWFDGYPVRHWDSHLAPRSRRLFVSEPDGTGGVGAPRDVTGDVGRALDDESLVLTPDGSAAVVSWQVDEGAGRRRRELLAIDLATGARRLLASTPGGYLTLPAVSPDGRWVAAAREERLTPEHAPRTELVLLPLDGSAEPRRLGVDVEHWPTALAFSADSEAVLFTTAEGGRGPLWQVGVEVGATATRLSADGAFDSLSVGPVAPGSPDPGVVLGLRSRVGTPPEVVSLVPGVADQTPTVLHAAPPAEPLPGRVEEVHATAADGTPLRAWLVLPVAAPGPSPLAVFIHGGPLASWNAWSWRWQPQLLAARGYAVLLPDPALSTGYGQRMIERGWQQWGGAPYDDVLALTDAALTRADLDAGRTAVLGGSYGGYLTNWVIGHTGRFRCAVTHASLWELTGFQGSTDDGWAWRDWFGDPVARADFYREWSPSTYADAISTPTLVIHGERDYRVPVGEGLRLWTDLQSRGVDSRLLYFPDENHWVLKPGNTRVWYDAVLGWLDRHLLAADWSRPALA